jgi:hypothetical protein
VVTDAEERLRPGSPVVLRLLLRTTSLVVLLTAAYYAWPSRSPTADAESLARLLAAIVSIGLVGSVLRIQIRAHRRSPRTLADVEALLSMLYLLVVLFAAVYNWMARIPGQFDGLHTKTDGLYFTVTVLATVGFGDVHAVGTAARALVTGQMLFGLLYIGTAVRLLSGSRSWEEDR